MTKEKFIKVFNEVASMNNMKSKWSVTENPLLDVPVLIEGECEKLYINSVFTGYSVNNVVSIKYYTYNQINDYGWIDHSKDYIAMHLSDGKIIYLLRGSFIRNFFDIELAIPMYNTGILLDSKRVYDYFKWFTSKDSPANGDFNIQSGVLVGYYGIQKTVIIPDIVTEIGPFAFAHNSRIHLVRAHANVKKIDEGAFYDCKNLTTVSFPGLEKYEDGVFWGCRINKMYVNNLLKDRLEMDKDDFNLEIKTFIFV